MSVERESVPWKEPDELSAAEDDDDTAVRREEEEVDTSSDAPEVTGERSLGLLELHRLLEVQLADEEPDNSSAGEADGRDDEAHVVAEVRNET